MAWGRDDATAVGEHWDAIEGDGGVERVPDEEVAVVERGGEDANFELAGLWLWLWDILQTEPVVVVS